MSHNAPRKKLPPSPAPTPGEWAADEANCGGGLNIRTVVRGREVIVGFTAEFKHAGETFIDEATAMANARLMASAKELAEVVEEFWRSGLPVGAPAWQVRLLTSARAALKKAGRL